MALKSGGGGGGGSFMSRRGAMPFILGNLLGSAGRGGGGFGGGGGGEVRVALEVLAVVVLEEEEVAEAGKEGIINGLIINKIKSRQFIIAGILLLCYQLNCIILFKHALNIIRYFPGFRF